MLIFKTVSKLKTFKGFSLVELSIIMAIIAVLAIIGFSMFTKSAKNRNLKDAAAAYMSDIKLAKQKAMTESVRYRITIDKTGNGYTVQDCCNADCSTLGCTYKDIKKIGSFGSGVKISNNNYSNITFQTRGTCSAGSIELENELGSKITVITTMMGRVRSEQSFK